MTKIRDGVSRDRKRAKRSKMKIGSRSVFLMQQLLYDRAMRMLKRKGEKK